MSKTTIDPSLLAPVPISKGGTGLTAIGTTSQELRVNSTGALQYINNVFNVIDYGATGNGTTDDTTAIQNAINAAGTASVSGTAPDPSASQPVVYFPVGNYKVSSMISTGAYTTLLGSRAILQLTTGTIGLSLNGYQNNITGMVILGGAKAITIATGGVDACTINIANCEFQGQTTSSIDSDTTSGSTITTISKCKFYNTNTGCVLVNMGSGDMTVIEDCWVETSSSVVFRCGTNAASLHLKNMFGVPLAGSGVWIENYNNTHCINCRFGGESGGGYTIVKNFATTGSVIVQDSYTFSSDYLLQFFAIPYVTIFKGNLGNAADATLFNFDSGITSANLEAVQASASFIWDVEINGIPQYNMNGTGSTAAKVVFQFEKEADQAQTLVTADKILEIPMNSGAFGQIQTSNNVSVVNTTNTFGAFAYGVTGTGANGFFYNGFQTALSGIAAGTYTAVFDINNTSGNILTCQLEVGFQSTIMLLRQGKHTVCVPFYWDGSSSSQNLFPQFYGLAVGQTFQVSRIRLFNGQVNINTQNTIVYGTAAPTTLQWEKGDMVISDVPAVGSPTYFVCTVAGTPGTWVSQQSVTATDTPTFASETLTATTNQLILGTTNTVTISSTAPSASRTYTIPDAGATANMVLDHGAYTIAGAWTHSATLTMSGATIAMGSNKITGLATPTTSGDALSWGNPISVTTAVLAGNISFTTTSTQGIVGTTTNDSAATGNVGEAISSLVGATNLPATTIIGNITSIALLAGDWDISYCVIYAVNAATWSEVDAGLDTATGNTTLGTYGSSRTLQTFASTSSAITTITLSLPPTRISLSTGATYFLKVYGVYTGGPPQAQGRISARRVR